MLPIWVIGPDWSPEKSYKSTFNPFLTHIYTYIYFAHPTDFFCLTNFEKQTKQKQKQKQKQKKTKQNKTKTKTKTNY